MILDNRDNPLNRNYYIPNSGFITLGSVTVRDRDGKCFNVDMKDDRYVSGELRHCKHGTKNKNPYPEGLSSRKRGKEKNSQKGSKNSQFGTKWINNGVDNKKIGKSDSTPEGWQEGAIQKKLRGVGWITNGLVNKRLDKNINPPEGWRRGRNK